MASCNKSVPTASLDSVTVTTTSCEQTSGTTKLILADNVCTATGSAGSFRYVIQDDGPRCQPS